MDINKLFPDMNDDQARKAFLEKVNRDLRRAESAPENSPAPSAHAVGIPPAAMAAFLTRFASAQDGGEDSGEEEAFDGEDYLYDDTAALVGLMEALRILSKHLSKKEYRKALRRIQRAMQE